MATLPRFVLTLFLSAGCVFSAFSQQSQLVQSSSSVAALVGSANPFNASPSAAPVGIMRPPAPSVNQGWFLRRFGAGTYSSPLGFGGQFAVSLSRSLVLRAGASDLHFGLNGTEDNIPYTANVHLQSEQAGVDWYPFHGNFHVTPGLLFGAGNRIYGSALITPGQSFSLNGVTYYSASSNPVNGSGRIDFRHTAPSLTLGWGSWIRRDGQSRHWAFPFEFGAAFMDDPKTELNFTGTVCANASQQYCQNIAEDPEVQANIAVERKRLQNNADYLRFYPIIAGGIVYRF